jgi:transcriptional regulator of acetoin/glycerol metabolism
VRELENALEFAATVCTGQTLQPEDLPPEIQEGATRGGHGGVEQGGGWAAPTREVRPPRHDQRTEAERDALTRTLEAHRWNRVDTARALGVSRSTLWRRMRDLGVG